MSWRQIPVSTSLREPARGSLCPPFVTTAVPRGVAERKMTTHSDELATNMNTPGDLDIHLHTYIETLVSKYKEKLL